MANGPGVWQEPTEEVFLRPGATVKMNLQLRDEGEAEIEAPVMSPLHGVIVDSKDRPVGGANIKPPLYARNEIGQGQSVRVLQFLFRCAIGNAAAR